MASKSRNLVLGGWEKIKVAIAQISPTYMNRDGCVTRAVSTIEDLGRNGAQFVVFPGSLAGRLPSTGRRTGTHRCRSGWRDGFSSRIAR